MLYNLLRYKEFITVIISRLFAVLILLHRDIVEAGQQQDLVTDLLVIRRLI